MMPTHVVTVFLRNDGRVLLLERSQAVGSYSGQWGGVAGHIESGDNAPSDDEIMAAATTEITEETGLDDAVTFVRQGTAFEVADTDLDTDWIVHPLLFDCAATTVDPNYETTDWEWVHPSEIMRRDTVPDLWQSYEAIAPTLDTIIDDDTHGSTYLSIRVLEVLRDRAATAAEQGTSVNLPNLARQLRDARPGMAAVRNRLNRVMYTAAQADGTTNPTTVERAATDAINTAVNADDRAASNAADWITTRAVTTSHSGTVETTLRQTTGPVLIAESRPGGEGHTLAASLADGDRPVTLTPDSTLPGRIDGDDTVIVGADAVLPDGRIHNKVGTYPIILAAEAVDADCIAVCAADKITPDATVTTPDAPDDTLEAPSEVTTANPLLETTPPDLFDAIITEEGALKPDEISDLADDRTTLATWDDPDQTPK